MKEKYTDHELVYAATARCKCGAGLAHPLEHADALELREWVCSAVLKGDAPPPARQRSPFGLHPTEPNDHEALDFAFWKVREESSVNNEGGHTTRPHGTRLMTVGHATCPKCSATWESEPYHAPTQRSHWVCGPCPKCGWSNGAGRCSDSRNGPSIERRFRDFIEVTS